MGKSKHRDIKNLLIVEGTTDASFFKELCKTLGLGVSVIVATPKEIGGAFNSKTDVFKALSDHLEQINDSKIERIAIVVDADAKEHNQGASYTKLCVAEIAKKHGFTLPESDAKNGCLFPHEDGLNPFGLWIMSNHDNEGALEDWLSLCISREQKSLFEYAKTCVDALPEQPLFKPLHQAKANIATWLAWQKKPGQGLYHCIEAGLLDETAQQYQALVSWLRAVFSPA
ncbi:DUF3226 domain-containing protein [Aquaspirillum sp. LM1]|uniref:DUF3226 domain-containing protein n=1 Tax=Aquaspirillum sp. LM1 TaxID=1938604 RepID=UPI0012372AE3|nr:DUF3226 domain-containing protein [Aquaspirillum sp. LM1]